MSSVEYNRTHPEVIKKARDNYSAKLRRAAKYAGLTYTQFLQLPLADRQAIIRAMKGIGVAEHRNDSRATPGTERRMGQEEPR